MVTFQYVSPVSPVVVVMPQAYIAQQSVLVRSPLPPAQHVRIETRQMQPQSFVVLQCPPQQNTISPCTVQQQSQVHHRPQQEQQVQHRPAVQQQQKIPRYPLQAHRTRLASLSKGTKRYTAVVTRIGEEPMLHIPGKGEFRFTYRSIKKKPGEPKFFVDVGNTVHCMLNSSNPPKAVSIRILSGTGIPLSSVPQDMLSMSQDNYSPATSSENGAPADSNQGSSEGYCPSSWDEEEDDEELQALSQPPPLLGADTPKHDPSCDRRFQEFLGLRRAST